MQYPLAGAPDFFFSAFPLCPLSSHLFCEPLSYSRLLLISLSFPINGGLKISCLFSGLITTISRRANKRGGRKGGKWLTAFHVWSTEEVLQKENSQCSCPVKLPQNACYITRGPHWCPGMKRWRREGGGCQEALCGWLAPKQGNASTLEVCLVDPFCSWWVSFWAHWVVHTRWSWRRLATLPCACATPSSLLQAARLLLHNHLNFTKSGSWFLLRVRLPGVHSRLICLLQSSWSASAEPPLQAETSLVTPSLLRYS